jgi:hypothetical protein
MATCPLRKQLEQGVSGGTHWDFTTGATVALATRLWDFSTFGVDCAGTSFGGVVDLCGTVVVSEVGKGFRLKDRMSDVSLNQPQKCQNA